MTEVKASDQTVARARRMFKEIEGEIEHHNCGHEGLGVIQDTLELLVAEVEQLRKRAMDNFLGDPKKMMIVSSGRDLNDYSILAFRDVTTDETLLDIRLKDGRLVFVGTQSDASGAANTLFKMLLSQLTEGYIEGRLAELKAQNEKAIGILESFFDWTADGWHGDSLDFEIMRGFIGKVEKALKGK